MATSRPSIRLARAIASIGALSACRSGPTRGAPLTLPAPFAADSQTTRVVAPGLVQRSLHVARGPWAIHVLDADPRRCWSLAATKAGGAASGRLGTLALATALNGAGGVNADFFTLTAPTGVPTSLHVQHGTLITGPSARPSLVVGPGGPRIAYVHATGRAIAGGDTVAIAGWNRAAPARAAGLTLYDDAYGARTDSAPNRLFLRLAAAGEDGRRLPLAIDSGAAAPIAHGELLLATPPGGAGVWRDRLRALAAHAAPIDVSVRLDAPGVREAVSGFPVLLRDGALAAEVDTSGAASFRARNPRSAVGLTSAGHVLLVVVDGRQAPYSDGMSMRELADLMRALGARDALNLDGGGSSTLVARDTTGSLRIVNRPSDKGVERAVGSALVVRACDAPATH